MVNGRLPSSQLRDKIYLNTWYHCDDDFFIFSNQKTFYTTVICKTLKTFISTIIVLLDLSVLDFCSDICIFNL